MKTAATTLPIDTVRVIITSKNHFGSHLRQLVHLNPNMIYRRYTDNTTHYNLVVPETNCKVRVTTTRYGAAYFEFSLPRLLYKDNSQFPTLEEARAAVDRLCELVGIDLNQADISRLDITHDTGFKVSNHSTLASKLKAPKRYQPEPYRYIDEKTGKYNGNFDFKTKPQAICTGSKTKRAKKVVLFYDKGGRQRIEMRLFSTATIGRSLGIGDQNLTLADVLTEDFVDIANSYYAKVIGEMTAKNPDDTLVKNFKKHALEYEQAGALH